jgi:hypothetical protein
MDPSEHGGDFEREAQMIFARFEIITVAVLVIIHRPVFYLKRDFSETGFCLRLQVESTHLDPIDGASLCL